MRPGQYIYVPMRWIHILSVLSVLSLLSACNEKKDEAWKANWSHFPPEARAEALKQIIEKVKPADLGHLALAARDTEPKVRAVAAEGLGKSREGYALDLLSDLLKDADERVQVAAAHAMGQHGNEKARKYLLLRFSRSRQPVRQAIVQALKASGVAEPMKQAVSFEAKELWEKAQQELASPPSLAEQVNAIVRLSESGRPEAAELLLPFLKEKAPVLVVAAAQGLASLGVHAALVELEALALSSNADIRQAAIAAVAQLQATSSIPLLTRLVETEEETALWALEGLTSFPSSPEADQAMCHIAIHSENRFLRLQAASALQQRAPCALPPLLEQLSKASMAETALLVLMRWPNAWSQEADKIWAFLKSENLVLSALAAHLLSKAYVQKELQEKPPKHMAYILERVDFLTKREEPWIKFPLEDGFGTRIFEEGAKDLERRQRQELLLRGLEASNALSLKEQGKQASRPLLLPELAENLGQAELEQLAAFLKLASFLQPQLIEEHLKRHMRASDVSLRAVALAAWVRMGAEHWELAEQGIFDQSEKVRLAVAEAFIEAGIEGEKHLLAALEKRAEESSALLNLLPCTQLDEKSAKILMGFLDKSIREASLAAHCLGKAKHTGAQEKLVALLNAATVVEKKTALEALKEMDAKVASKEIENQLFHESPEIRQAAVRVLRYLKVGDAGEMLEALGEDYFKKVRHSMSDI
ncbi:MAG: HEAT repeat domain-containing protein [Cystobacterineae bacterium]|nr:HEAT repeat domain-containing protein [Cystobacterineae bacterium]